MDINSAILVLAPTAQYEIIGESVEGISWLSAPPHPTNAEILAKMAEEMSVNPDYPTFRNTIAKLPAWRSLVASDGRAVELSRCLSEQDLATAMIWWGDLVAAGLISDELKANIAQAAITANMPPAIA
jgi:hypothetical protein